VGSLGHRSGIGLERKSGGRGDVLELSAAGLIVP
jgi:hypothetical protein